MLPPLCCLKTHSGCCVGFMLPACGRFNRLKSSTDHTWSVWLWIGLSSFVSTATVGGSRCSKNWEVSGWKLILCAQKLLQQTSFLCVIFIGEGCPSWYENDIQYPRLSPVWIFSQSVTEAQGNDRSAYSTLSSSVLLAWTNSLLWWRGKPVLPLGFVIITLIFHIGSDFRPRH